MSDEELQRRTSWARAVIEQRWKTLSPFQDKISLGAKAPLPKTFEKATAIARRMSVHELIDIDLDELLFSAAERLGEIYLAQLDHRDVSQGDQDANEVVAIAKPLKKTQGRQGFGLSAPERRAVEQRAMALAEKYLSAAG